jgi:hypothetical protein
MAALTIIRHSWPIVDSCTRIGSAWRKTAYLAGPFFSAFLAKHASADHGCSRGVSSRKRCMASYVDPRPELSMWAVIGLRSSQLSLGLCQRVWSARVLARQVERRPGTAGVLERAVSMRVGRRARRQSLVGGRRGGGGSHASLTGDTGFRVGVNLTE